MIMFENIYRTGKIFLIGFLFGALFLIISEIFFGLAAETAYAFLEARVGFFPAKPLLLFLTIFLNNLVVILIASMGAVGLVFFLMWGRRNFSWWNKLNDSRLGDLIDGFVWRITRYFKPELEKIDEKINKDIFIVIYGLPTLVMIVNGWFLGFVFAREALANKFVGVLTLLKWIAPHGILEIPILLASASVGFTLADKILKPLSKDGIQEVKKTARKEIRNKALLRALIIIITVLVMAAYIEVYITPRIATAGI